MLRFGLLIFFICSILSGFWAQEVDPQNTAIVFKKSPESNLGFDDFYHPEWVDKYENGSHSAHISVRKNVGDEILLAVRDTTIFQKNLRLILLEEQIQLSTIQINDSIHFIALPPRDSNYTVGAYVNDSLIKQLSVHILDPLREKIIVVPLTDIKIDSAYLLNYLNKTYRQANLSFDVHIHKKFAHSEFPDTLKFDNPSSSNNRYTQQMRYFRDLYFETYPNADREAYYIFIIEGFVNKRIKGFMPKNKSMAFIRSGSAPKMYHTIARKIAHGVGMLDDSWKNQGPKIGTSSNLMDTLGGIDLTFWQWEQIQLSAHSYSFFDEDEDLKTNNGMVAYYFWEEDEHGVIHLDPKNPLLNINRPYKKNYRSYHLNIEDYFFKTLFHVGDYFICFWHLISAAGLLLFIFLSRRKVLRMIDNNPHVSRFWKRPLVVILLLIGLGSYVGIFQIINAQLKRYEVRSGHIVEFKGKSYDKVQQVVLFNKGLKHKEEEDLQSEILIRRGDDWYVKHRKRVLYFELFQDSLSQWTNCKFHSDGDSLILSSLEFSALAESHYFVFSYVDSLGKYKNQKVFNHLGIDVTEKLTVEDATKRILILVNGYRPTSLGRTFEDNFGDIQKNGLEFPNSRDLIFDFDRYDYWRPWKEIDQLFKKRINPSEIYYADGHFSVATSNHKSLINFSSNSLIYPKRCTNPNKHTCYHTKVTTTGLFGGTEWVKTKELLASKPNKKGFRERREHGRVAGKNLIMMLNEFPNRASNDTVYIVAHSMGYAYSLGILDELRGKINFGGFYIIAPENAESGDINMDEWEEIWQYGCNFNQGEMDPPCLQDGVAPQSKVGGLNERNRVYIPRKYYTRKGYFDSHFIGYYTWIFDIPEGNAGAIKQR